MENAAIKITKTPLFYLRLISTIQVKSSTKPKGGGWGHSIKVLYGGGEDPLRGPKVPLSRLSPFHILVYTVYLLAVVNFPSFKWLDHWTRRFSGPFHSHKMRLLAISDPFTDRNDKFPPPFVYWNWWDPYRLYSCFEKGCRKNCARNNPEK